MSLFNKNRKKENYKHEEKDESVKALYDECADDSVDNVIEVKRTMGKRGRVIVAVAVAVIAVGLSISYMRYSAVKTYDGFDVVKSVETSGDNIADYFVFAGNVLKVTKDGASYIDETGTVKWDVSYAMKMPKAEVCGDYAIVADMNGKDAVLKKDIVDDKGLMKAIMDENEKLDGIDFESINADCESYLQNIGRNMFYTVAAGYITLYLAVVFLIIANTIIGVQFLMGQRKSGRRYRTLVKLGATYEMLCSSANRQVGWYFGIPVAVAAVSSIFGVRALLTGILSESMRGSVKQILIIAAVMIILLCVVEYIYMTAVKRSSNRYLMAMMTPERVE